jgi:hypothetical protein
MAALKRHKLAVIFALSLLIFVTLFVLHHRVYGIFEAHLGDPVMCGSDTINSNIGGFGRDCNTANPHAQLAWFTMFAVSFLATLTTSLMLLLKTLKSRRK